MHIYELLIHIHKKNLNNCRRSSLFDRWSLIASRLPGRTANDVKNYWNTHIKKKCVASVSDEKHKAHSMAKIEVIKPHPRTFKNFSSITSREATMEFFSSDLSILNSGNFNSTPIISHQPQLVENNETNWWEGLLSDNHAIVEVGATNGANITTSVVAEETSEAVAIDPLCSLDVVANESWHGSDWSVDVLYDMTFNFQEILQENDELIAQ
ncbi:hypothetical protein SAY86_014207 [Trapa natans]|uniref:Uncharacterized protein n=1 Tax=Trapa natans TaxID=22666 RepID=A0AAN7L0P6_TRANT|nr:hypothetical protein SAY86_014207 [Trapa natans]